MTRQFTDLAPMMSNEAFVGHSKPRRMKLDRLAAIASPGWRRAKPV